MAADTGDGSGDTQLRYRWYRQQYVVTELVFIPAVAVVVIRILDTGGECSGRDSTFTGSSGSDTGSSNDTVGSFIREL